MNAVAKEPRSSQPCSSDIVGIWAFTQSLLGSFCAGGTTCSLQWCLDRCCVQRSGELRKCFSGLNVFVWKVVKTASLLLWDHQMITVLNTWDFQFWELNAGGGWCISSETHPVTTPCMATVAQTVSRWMACYCLWAWACFTDEWLVVVYEHCVNNCFLSHNMQYSDPSTGPFFWLGAELSAKGLLV